MALSCLLLTHCDSRAQLQIGSKIDTEGAILGYIQLLALQRAGFTVEDRIETGPTLITRRALLYGELDGYIEYTGTALVNFMGEKSNAVLTKPDTAWSSIANWDSSANGMIWLEPWSGINNTYTVLIGEKLAAEANLKTISDLQRYLKEGGRISFGTDPEFAVRPDGLPGLQKAYNFDSVETFSVRQMDAGLVYQTLQQGSIDAAIGYATDGRISAYGLQRLADDRNYFPVYNPAPVFRAETIRKYPNIRAVLQRVAAKLTANDITRMNYLHDVEFKRARVLAEEWLKANQLW